MKAHVIVFGKEIKFIVLGGEKEAKKKMEKVTMAYYRKNKKKLNYVNVKSYEEFCQIDNKNILTVDCEEKKKRNWEFYYDWIIVFPFFVYGVRCFLKLIFGG